MIRSTVAFVDGENLVFRYQELLKAGRKPKATTQHILDVAVWSNVIYDKAAVDLQRINYYTSTVGDDEHINNIHDTIQSWGYSYKTGTTDGRGRLTPHVFKKPSKSQKSRSVDIRITLDSLVTAYTHDVNQLILLTGDGDFIPVIEQLMRHGKQVIVGSLSSGLHPDLKRTGDYFFQLDPFLFET